MGNVDALANLATVDGMRFIWPYGGSDEHQRRYNRICQMIADAAGMPDAEVRSYLKYKRIKSGRQDGGELTALFIGGKLAKAVPVEWIDANINHLTELHVKVWLIDAKQGAHNALIDEVYNAKGGKYKPTIYGPERGRGRNQPGAKGLTFGTDKAGIHITVNRYRDCRTHIEAHVQGAVLSAIVADTLRRQGANSVAGTISEIFPAVQYEAAYRGIERVCGALRSRGLRLTDHFKAGSSVSWIRPLFADNSVPLSDQEEKVLAVNEASREQNISDDEQLTLELD